MTPNLTIPAPKGDLEVIEGDFAILEDEPKDNSEN